MATPVVISPPAVVQACPNRGPASGCRRAAGKLGNHYAKRAILPVEKVDGDIEAQVQAYQRRGGARHHV